MCLEYFCELLIVSLISGLLPLMRKEVVHLIMEFKGNFLKTHKEVFMKGILLETLCDIMER